jgi:acetyl esterase/lipase
MNICDPLAGESLQAGSRLPSAGHPRDYEGECVYQRGNMKRQSKALCVVTSILMLGLGAIHAQQSAPANPPQMNPKLMEYLRNIMPQPQMSIPLYGDGAIPNSKPTPDEEVLRPMGQMANVTRPTLEVFLPAKVKANGASIIVFPGGGYVGLTWNSEGPSIGQFFQDHGIAAFVVKYRLPTDATMVDKSIGPLQDAQQAMIVVRQRAKEWNLDPHRVGIIGFSAGGHLASTLGTHFMKAYVPNPDQISLRPDFMILLYPVISMDPKIAHMGSRIALLGPQPSDEQVQLFSNELQVTKDTPPTLLIQSADDHLVDVDNSIRFFEALRHAGVQVDMTILNKGEHALVLIPKDRWQSIITNWIELNGWMNQKSE